MTPDTAQSTVLDAFGVELLGAIYKICEQVSFVAGERIFEQGSPGDDFFIVNSGQVRIEVSSKDIDTDAVLEYAVAGDFLGEEALLGGSDRWASAVADTDVKAVRVSQASLKRLYEESPKDGVAVLRAMGRYTATRLRAASDRVAETLADDAPDGVVEEMVAAAVVAQTRVCVVAGGSC